MTRKFISKTIGKPTEASVVRGRENVPEGDDFSWWTYKIKYKNRKTGEEFFLEKLQEIFELGFADKKLWDIIERDYDTVDLYTMNVNHPRYKSISDEDLIVFVD